MLKIWDTLTVYLSFRTLRLLPYSWRSMALLEAAITLILVHIDCGLWVASDLAVLGLKSIRTRNSVAAATAAEIAVPLEEYTSSLTRSRNFDG